MEPNELTEEQKAKARECKTEEEFSELAGQNNMELSLDELDAAAGGRGDMCRNYAARCRRYDKTLVLACPAYTERGWD